jgi:signal recognition particle subunit SRP54
MEDLLEQMQQIKRMGPLQNIIGMLPGVPKELKNADIGEKELGRVEAIIRSMTTEERRKPDLINGSRKTRIANGSGTSTAEVNLLLKQFKDVSKMMKRFGGVAKQGNSKKGKRRGGPALPNLKQLKQLQELQGQEESALDILRRS